MFEKVDTLPTKPLARRCTAYGFLPRGMGLRSLKEVSSRKYSLAIRGEPQTDVGVVDGGRVVAKASPQACIGLVVPITTDIQNNS